MTSAASASPLWAFRGAGALAVVAATLAGCAEPPSQHARRSGEFFSVARYGPASPRVVDDGEPVPRGGGQYLVGHPYTIAGRTYYPTRERALRGRRHGLVVRRRLPRTAHRQRRSLRHALAVRGASDHAAAELRARHQPRQRLFDDRSRQRSRPLQPRAASCDVSSRVADMLDIKSTGTAKVKVEYVGPAPLAGTDDDDPGRQPAHRRQAGDARRVAGEPDHGRRGRAAATAAAASPGCRRAPARGRPAVSSPPPVPSC